MSQIYTDNTDKNPSKVPNNSKPNKNIDIFENPIPESVVNEGDFIGYDGEGTLYLINGDTVDNHEFASWTSYEMNIEVGGFYSSSHSIDREYLTGESLYTLAENILEECNSPDRKIQDKEGYGEVSLI